MNLKLYLRRLYRFFVLRIGFIFRKYIQTCEMRFIFVVCAETPRLIVCLAGSSLVRGARVAQLV
jgi:hypothetical protein